MAIHVRIQQEQIRILYSHRMTAYSGSLVIALATAIALWPVTYQNILTLWFLAATGLVISRFLLSCRYDTLSPTEQDTNHRYWANQYAAFSLANGLIWGMVPVIFPIPTTEHFALILVMHAGYIAGAVSSTSIYLPAFMAFVLPSSLLFLIGTILNGGTSLWLHAVLIVFYCIVTVFFALRNNSSVVEQISLRLQNHELLSDLRRQRDKSEQAMLAKNRFLAAASHDLRQPVHALGLFVASLEAHQEFDERQHILAKIKQSTAALGGLFHGLLDISKLDANVVENEPQDINLDELLLLIKTQFQDSADEKNLQLNIPTDTDLVAFVDPSLLERILRNLVDNAINYTERGSVSILVSDIKTDTFVLSVNDTGKGIPVSEHNNIFSEYHQLENPERNRQKGLGLGLAIVRRLCDLMNIPIEVESRHQTGSSFKLTIGVGTKNLAPAPSSSTPEPAHRTYKIVVIDDEQDIIDGMHQLLTSWGCATTTATSTHAALAALDSTDTVPDIIIADFRLQGNESGLDAIRDIREEFNSDIPAILITGDTAPERLQQAARASVQVLHKPVEPARLRQLLDSLSIETELAVS